ncbi:MAG: hypothetical protein Q4A90_04560 [Streptococcus sp.]|nr:hypothetical protein [Streptococcus sp.]
MLKWIIIIEGLLLSTICILFILSRDKFDSLGIALSLIVISQIYLIYLAFTKRLTV